MSDKSIQNWNPVRSSTVMWPDGREVVSGEAGDDPEGTVHQGDEFGSFEKLAGKIAQVPKAEIDEQRQKS